MKTNKQPLKSVDEDIMTALSSSITGTDFTVDWERIKTALHSYTASREKKAYDEGRESRQAEIDFLREEAYGDTPDKTK